MREFREAVLQTLNFRYDLTVLCPAFSLLIAANILNTGWKVRCRPARARGQERDAYS